MQVAAPRSLWLVSLNLFIFKWKFLKIFIFYVTSNILTTMAGKLQSKKTMTTQMSMLASPSSRTWLLQKKIHCVNWCFSWHIYWLLHELLTFLNLLLDLLILLCYLKKWKHDKMNYNFLQNKSNNNTNVQHCCGSTLTSLLGEMSRASLLWNSLKLKQFLSQFSEDYL